MGLAIQSMLEKGVGSTTLEFKISLVRAITLETGRLRAEGKVLNCGRRVGTAEGRLIDAKGRLLAHGTTTCLIFPSPSAMSARGSKPEIRTGQWHGGSTHHSRRINR
jgi:acyl-coenzyme A thioesterase PaaI-like protein